MRLATPIFCLAVTVSWSGEQTTAPVADQVTPHQTLDCCSNRIAGSGGVFAPLPQRGRTKRKEGPATCDNFAGTWRVPENDLAPMILFQGRGCTLSGAFHSHGPGATDHFVSGTAYSSGAVITVRRTNTGGCETRMFGTLSYQPDGTMTYAISATTGSCDLPVDFKETRVWVRQ